jgi:hypothetical protein
MLDAMAADASIYDAIRIAQSAPAAAPVEVPATLGTQGASPTGTEKPTDNRPQKFKSTDDAVADWADKPPKKFQ